MASASNTSEPPGETDFTTSLHTFMDGSSFLHASAGSGKWGQHSFEEDGNTIDTGKSFPSMYDIGDMDDGSEMLSNSALTQDPFTVNDEANADEAIKKVSENLSMVLDEFKNWLEKNSGHNPQDETGNPETPSKSRQKKRSLEEKLEAWRSGIGQANITRRRSIGSTSELPSLVDCSDYETELFDTTKPLHPIQSGKSSSYSNDAQNQGSFESLAESIDSMAELGQGCKDSTRPETAQRTRLAGRREDVLGGQLSSIPKPPSSQTAPPSLRKSLNGLKTTIATNTGSKKNGGSLSISSIKRDAPQRTVSPVPRVTVTRRSSPGSLSTKSIFSVGGVAAPPLSASPRTVDGRKSARRGQLSSDARSVASAFERLQVPSISPIVREGKRQSGGSPMTGRRSPGTLSKDGNNSRPVSPKKKSGNGGRQRKATSLHLERLEGSKSSLVSGAMNKSGPGLSSDGSKISVVSGNTDSSASVGSPTSVVGLKERGVPGERGRRARASVGATKKSSSRESVQNTKERPSESLPDQMTSEQVAHVRQVDSNKLGRVSSKSPRSSRKHLRPEKRRSKNSGGDQAPAITNDDSKAVPEQGPKSPSKPRRRSRDRTGTRHDKRRGSLRSEQTSGGNMPDLAPFTNSLRRELTSSPQPVHVAHSPRSRRHSSLRVTEAGTIVYGNAPEAATSVTTTPRTRERRKLSLNALLSPRLRRKHVSAPDSSALGIQIGPLGSPEIERSRKHRRRRVSTGSTTGDQDVHEASAATETAGKGEKAGGRSSNRPDLAALLDRHRQSGGKLRRANTGSANDQDETGEVTGQAMVKSEHTSASQGQRSQSSTRSSSPTKSRALEKSGQTSRSRNRRSERSGSALAKSEHTTGSSSQRSDRAGSSRRSGRIASHTVRKQGDND